MRSESSPVRTQVSFLLIAMLPGLPGCWRSTSSDGGQHGESPQAVSLEPDTTEFAVNLAVRAMDVSLTPQQRREAATQMLTAAEPDAALPTMRILLSTSEDDAIRQMMAKRIGDMRDMDSSPQLLDALGDTSPAVQEAAAHSLLKMLGRDFFFRAGDSPEHRRAAQARYRRYWQDILASPSTHQRLRERNQQLRREKEQSVWPTS